MWNNNFFFLFFDILVYATSTQSTSPVCFLRQDGDRRRTDISPRDLAVAQLATFRRASKCCKIPHPFGLSALVWEGLTMTWQDSPKKNVPVAKRKWNNGNKIFTKSLKYETVKFMPLDHVGQTNKFFSPQNCIIGSTSVFKWKFGNHDHAQYQERLTSAKTTKMLTSNLHGVYIKSYFAKNCEASCKVIISTGTVLPSASIERTFIWIL